MSSVLRLECKHSSNAFRIRIFLFLSFSLGIETITTFIRSRSSLENHTQFQTKMGKVYTLFSDQKGLKTPPSGIAHTYMAFIRECNTTIYLWSPRLKAKAEVHKYPFCRFDPKLCNDMIISFQIITLR